MKLSYKSEILKSMIEGLIKDKLQNKGWIVRPNNLLEDIAGNVFTVDLIQTLTESKIILRKVDII